MSNKDIAKNGYPTSEDLNRVFSMINDLASSITMVANSDGGLTTKQGLDRIKALMSQLDEAKATASRLLRPRRKVVFALQPGEDLAECEARLIKLDQQQAEQSEEVA